MSGHSKWSTIKHKKGAADAKRGKIFTKHAKLITIAAQGSGGDPETNPALKAAIDKAKSDNVPNTNIERAIKKGTGESKDGNRIEEFGYEGYGPDGVAIIINCLSDNKNRAYTNVRTIMSKGGGSIGESGCVGWMFKKRGVVRIEINDAQKQDEIELQAIDAGAEDIAIDDNIVEISTTVENFEHIDKVLRENFSILSAEVEMIPENTVKIEDVDKAQKILRLIDTLNEDEDVSDVYANFDIPDEVLASLSQ
jgi:YebC/PmpR family DNA-binding regulatory protein